ncbi:phospholipase D-like domain-containing protein [Nocardioides sp.]|uniref:methyltransferase domain-containing protein n=1 Tax=Nocardioides sp. TaxID=35761 RepID=UPI002613FFE2|nr:phospholipase D-like domain-containing protein [Nocardioides sp.]
MTADEKRAAARELAHAAGAAGDPLGWFEPLYRAAAEGTATVPWADLAPNPLLTSWTGLADLPPGTAVVVGCGYGDDAEWLAAQGWHVTAFDLSPTAIEACRARFPDSTVDYRVVDLLDSESLGRFDLVVEIYTVQVLPPLSTERASAVSALRHLTGRDLLVIARGRDEADDPGSMPWPLTPTEMTMFGQGGVRTVTIEDLPDPVEPAVRRLRGHFRRSPTPRVEEWFLDREGRGNPSSAIDDHHRPGEAFSRGNLARPLVHGSTYFAELLTVVEATGEGDRVWFTDWQSNPDERLGDGIGTELLAVLARAIERGVDVRALVWRSHSGVIGYSHEEHRDLASALSDLGGAVQLDMRTRPNGAHHQKFVVVRHRDDPTRDIAYVGGIDLCHGRRDDALHHGDPQAETIASEYGDLPPWHDVQLALQGPVVHDVETVFRERWRDSTPTSRNPLRRLRDRFDGLAGTEVATEPLPPQTPPPPRVRGANHAVQLLRTYPALGNGWAFDFAPDGERSVARGYSRAVSRARSLIYIEDQFLWGGEMSTVLVEALQANPELRLIAVLPQFPDQEGWFARDPQMLGRMRGVLKVLLAAPERVAFYGLENHAGTPVYVHAKVCVLDDDWASIGSDNFCRRSWTNDSELSAAVVDLGLTTQMTYAERLRLTLAAEHLDRLDPDQMRAGTGVTDEELRAVMADCTSTTDLFDRFAEAADALEAWHAGGRVGPRPPGRLRRLPEPRLPVLRQLLAAPWYRYLHDPDGRPLRLRLRDEF